MIEIFGYQTLKKIYPKFPYSKTQLEQQIDHIFTNHVVNTNIIFEKSVNIKRMNMEYRKKNEVTDVLSFSLDTKGIPDEVYISPEYVMKNFSSEKYVEEILRLIIHGILHILKYDHTEKFDEQNIKEEMYIIQEEKLTKLLQYLNK
jgi:rRNA maturation RNase YbeY